MIGKDELPGFKEIKDAIMKAKKEGISMELMMTLARQGTKFFNIGTNILKEDDSFDIVTVMIMFHIDIERTKEIIIYIKNLITDHNGSAADVLRDIYHNMPGYEKYFAAYILGKNFTEKDVNEQTKISKDIIQKLDIENFDDITTFIDNLFEKEVGSNPAPSSIKKIMESNFEENEKIFMVFIYGLR